MDPYADDSPEFTGSLVTMAFGLGGRIAQLWASDPALPEEGEQFQFILPPLAFGEESAEDYYPGTLLVGARTNEDEPWMLSRNSSARQIFPADIDEADDPTRISFEYDLPLLEDLHALGHYHEVLHQMPVVVWELELRNRGRASLEIGELGFPLAFNNFYDGFGWSDDQLRRLWTSRLYLHPFVGGAASWLFAQRMTAEPPGLLVFPGEGTGWEFMSYVRASLNTPHQWEGIPVVYAYSRATVEREGWLSWWNDHTSTVLEPGETRKFEMCFVPAERDKQDGVFQTLLSCGRPAIRLLPSAVAPADVGIAIEVAGSTPTRFTVSGEALVETDADDEGGFCFIKPANVGPVRVSFEDDAGRLSHVHLFFTDPIEDLIRRRAEWIATNQVHRDPRSTLDHALLLTNIHTKRRVTEPEEYSGSSGLECSLADALFLAQKNALYPVPDEIEIVENYVSKFLQDDVQNPMDLSVGSVLGDGSGIGTHLGRPMTYPHAFNLYHALYRIATVYDSTRRPARAYLELAGKTALAMFHFGWRHYVLTVGVLGYGRIYKLLEDLRAEDLLDLSDQLEERVDAKANQLTEQEYPFAGESVLDTSGYEDVFRAGLHLDDDEHLERTIRCAYAARSLAPSWWWYGSDKRAWDGADSAPRAALLDRGEECLGHTTIPNSLMFFEALDRDYLAIPDAHMRLAFGGMMGPWALVHADGSSSLCYCPDMSSRHYGSNAYTGASGLGYYHYLVGVGSYVLPNQDLSIFTFGCRFEVDETRYRVKPWDGVGRRVVLRQIGAAFEISFGKIEDLELDLRKRWVKLTIANPADWDVEAEVAMSGMWGPNIELEGSRAKLVEGVARATVKLPARSTRTYTGKVVL